MRLNNLDFTITEAIIVTILIVIIFIASVSLFFALTSTIRLKLWERKLQKLSEQKFQKDMR